MHPSVERLHAELETPARDFLAEATDRLRTDPSRLPVLFPQLPRRLGKDWLGGGRIEADGAVLDLDAWRRCDAGALELLLAIDSVDAEALTDLCRHGDLEERTMVLRTVTALPIGPATGALLREAQQTNQVVHVAAASLDSDLLARAHADQTAAGLDDEDVAKLLLKVAFLDLPLDRVLRFTECATEPLSRMLQGLATEREAAGRKVWYGTNELIGYAPTDGTVPRLLGGLEHGVAEHRLSAARGLAALGDAQWRPLLEQRLEREDDATVRAALQQAKGQLEG